AHTTEAFGTIRLPDRLLVLVVAARTRSEPWTIRLSAPCSGRSRRTRSRRSANTTTSGPSSRTATTPPPQWRNSGHSRFVSPLLFRGRVPGVAENSSHGLARSLTRQCAPSDPEHGRRARPRPTGSRVDDAEMSTQRCDPLGLDLVEPSGTHRAPPVHLEQDPVLA